MSLHFDKTGNVYKIDEKVALVKKKTVLPLIDDLINSISGAILCSGGGGCGLA